NNYLDRSPALSQEHLQADTIASRQIAVLVAEGFDMKAYKKMKEYLEKQQAVITLIAPHGGTIRCNQGLEHAVGAALMTTESVLFDALYIPGGKASIEALKAEAKVFKFIN